MFVCVLKSGGIYGPSHVERLQKQLGKPLKCLTDLKFTLSDVQTIPLEYNLSGWWSKIELFRPDLLKGPHVYLDLDVSIVGNPEELYCDEFTMVRDFIRTDKFNSSVMAWKEVPTKPFLQFNPTIINKYKRWPNLGDQAYLEDTIKPISSFNYKLVKSYRVDCKEGIPEGTVVVAYHGKPKPWDIE